MFKNKKLIIIILVIAAVGIFAYFMLGSDDSNTPSKITKPNTKPTQPTRKPNSSGGGSGSGGSGGSGEGSTTQLTGEARKKELLDRAPRWFLMEIVNLYYDRKRRGVDAKYLSIYYLGHQIIEDALALKGKLKIDNALTSHIDFMIANNYTIDEIDTISKIKSLGGRTYRDVNNPFKNPYESS